MIEILAAGAVRDTGGRNSETDTGGRSSDRDTGGRSSERYWRQEQ